MWTKIASLAAVSVLSAGLLVGSASPAAATPPGLDGMIAGIDSGGVYFVDPVDGSSRYVMSGHHVAWSPTGNQLAVVDGSRLNTMNVDGTADQLIAYDAVGRATWSPDGTKIAYHSRDGLKIVNADGTDPTVILTGGFDMSEWSPDGQWLVGHRLTYEPGDEDADIWKIGVDGANLTKVVDLPGHQIKPTISPDGTQIAFEDWVSSTDHEIGVVGFDGGEVTNLTNSPGLDNGPTWSPSGTRIAFTSSREGGGLLTMAPDGSNVEKIPLGLGAIDEMTWQPAQVTLFTAPEIVNAGNRFALHVRIAATATDNPSVTIQRRVKGGLWTDWLTRDVDADGSRVINVSIAEHTYIRAVWAGDATHPGGTSVHAYVRARAVVTGKLLRFDRVSGRWKLYGAGDRIHYRSDIFPNLAGKDMCFDFERLVHSGRWRDEFEDCYKIGASGVTKIVIFNVPVGTRARVRAEYDAVPDRRHLRDSAPWDYLRVVS